MRSRNKNSSGSGSQKSDNSEASAGRSVPLSPSLSPAAARLSGDSATALPGGTVPSELASRVLRQYLLTEEEAGELSGSEYVGGGVSRCLSDAGDAADNDDSGSESHSRAAGSVYDADENGASLANPLRLASGSITYDIYKWHRDNERSAEASGSTISRVLGQTQDRRRSRARSLSVCGSSGMPSESEWDLPLSHAQITEPGGFRRHYIHQQAEDEGRSANILTANFVDFLALYGHFAGGDFPSDEDDDTEAEAEMDADVETETEAGAEEADVELEPGRQLLDVGAGRRHARRIYGSMGTSSATGGRRARRSGAMLRDTLTQSGRASLAGRGQVSNRHTQGRRGQVEQTAGATVHTASVRKSFFLLLKSFVSAGVLFMPRAFYNGGLAFSVTVMVGVAFAALYTMLLLVRCYERVHCGYGEMGRRLYGRWMEAVVLLSIVTSQIGFTCAGVIFVATNVRDLFNAVTDCQMRLSLSFWVLAQMAVLVPLCLVRHIKGLSGVALLADVFVVAGLVYVWAVDVSKISRLGMGYVRNFNPEHYSLFLGSAAYTFEGYALILPIVDAMKRPDKFPMLLALVMAICGTVAVSIGGLSYAAFGEETEAIVLLNMPSGTVATLTVQLLYSLAILFTAPLMMFPVIRILEQVLFPRRSGKRNPAVKMQKNVFRTLLLVLVMIISVVGVERLDRLVAIIGGLACVPISFIFPPLFHLRAVAQTRWERVRDRLLAAAGLAVCVYVTRGAISQWSVNVPPYDFCDAS
ncbi:hypothetical protein H4S08_003913 [Coemansia sp. RSA 1365]|nr:hypothetical protein H4S08_003913 [Coemansia sp. RSA 1365]